MTENTNSNINIPTITVHATTREMYNDWFDSFKEMFWSEDLDNRDLFWVGVRALSRGSMEDIRTLFRDGMTACLVPSSMCALDTAPKADAEIRIYHHDKLIGVIINSEIVY